MTGREGKRKYREEIMLDHADSRRWDYMMKDERTSFVRLVKPDCVYYSQQNIIGVTSEPEPMHRAVPLTHLLIG